MKELRYVNTYRDRHGRLRSYYRRGKHRQRIDGKKGSADWLANYARIHKCFEDGGRKAPDHETLQFAIARYRESQRYQKLSINSQKTYLAAISRLEEKLGHRGLKEFTRGSVIKIRDQIADRAPGMAMLTVKVLNLIFETARDLDMIDRNPAKGVQAPAGHTSSPHRTWTQDELSLMLTTADPFVRRAVTVLLYTGLRASDAVKLKRSSIKNGVIPWTTQKTKTDVVIPLHAALRAELSRSLPVESIYIVPGRRGQQMTRSSISMAIRRQFEAFNWQDMPPMHGLRKNAVTALIEAGCTPRQIQAITGQSMKMIEHYGQAYERSELAAQAIRLWEESQS